MAFALSAEKQVQMQCTGFLNNCPNTDTSPSAKLSWGWGGGSEEDGAGGWGAGMGVRARSSSGPISQVGHSLRSIQVSWALQTAGEGGGPGRGRLGWEQSSCSRRLGAGALPAEHAGRARRVAASAQTFPLQCGVPRAPPITTQLHRDVCSSPLGRAGQRFGAEASLAKGTFKVSCLPAKRPPIVAE